MVSRQRELDVVAVFGACAERSDGQVEQELPAAGGAEREHARDEPGLAVDSCARPGLVDGQKLVVHAEEAMRARRV